MTPPREFYNERYARKLSNELPRVRAIRIIDNLYYQILLERLPRAFGAYLVDVGSGIADHLTHWNGPAIAIDISEVALSRYRGRKVVADAKAIPLASSSASACTCIETLEHLRREDGGRVIRELLRITRKGGPIIISVPNESDINIWCRFFNNIFRDAGHLARYTRNGIINLIADEPCEIVTFTHGYFCLGCLLLLERSPFLKKILNGKSGKSGCAVRLLRLASKLLNLETRLLNRFFEGFRVVAIIKSSNPQRQERAEIEVPAR